MSRHRYTEEDLLQAMAEFRQAHGHYPRVSRAVSRDWADDSLEKAASKKQVLPSYQTYKARFGGLKKAQQIVDDRFFGGEPADRSQTPRETKHTPEALIQSLVDYIKNTGEEPKYGRPANRWGPETLAKAAQFDIVLADPSTYTRRIGGIRLALNEARKRLGMREETPPRRSMSDAEMLEMLNQIYMTLGRYPKCGHVKWDDETIEASDRLGVPLPARETYIRRFGGLSKAFQAAANLMDHPPLVPPAKKGRTSADKQHMLELAKAFYERFGHWPMSGSKKGGWAKDTGDKAGAISPRFPCAATYSNKFGSLTAAWEEAQAIELEPVEA